MNRKFSSIVKRGAVSLLVLSLLFVFHSSVSSASATQFGLTGPSSQAQLSPLEQGQPNTPLQKSLKNAIEERKKAGLPVPASITYESNEALAPEKQSVAATSAQHTLITGKTTIFFEHPNQAGLDKWPDFVVDDNMPSGATGFVSPGDYTQTVHDKLEQEHPGIWEEYEFGYEPRTYIFEETYEATPLEENLQAPALQSTDFTEATPYAEDEIVMGFTKVGPGVNHVFETGAWIGNCNIWCYEVYYVKIGFQLDWGLGLRLPAKINLTSPASMVEGSQYMLTSTMDGLDWGPDSYKEANVPEKDGKEYVLHFNFFLGAIVRILGIKVVDWQAVNANFNLSEDFETPLGPHESFPAVISWKKLPPEKTELEWNVLGILYLGLGLHIGPSFGSQEVSADWQVMPGSNAAGSGKVTYTASNVPGSFDGQVTAGAPNATTDEARIRLTNFRYRFTHFTIRLDGYLDYQLFQFKKKSSDPFYIASWSIADVPHDGGGLIIHPKSTPTFVEASATVPSIPQVGDQPDQTTNEGDTFNLAATFSDHNVLDTHTATINWNDGSPVEAWVVAEGDGYGTVSGSHLYPDNGSHTVTVTVCDNDGHCTSDNLLVTVNNVAPNVGSINGPTEASLGTEITVDATFTDPGLLDTHTAIWDWGDGTTTDPASLTQGAGSGSVADSHTYLVPGTHTVQLIVTDKDGGVGQASHTVIVESPADPIMDLIAAVEALNLPQGLENELLTKLNNAVADLERGQSNGAVGKLGAFINSVEAQRGKKISEADANVLIQMAQGVINTINNG